MADIPVPSLPDVTPAPTDRQMVVRADDELGLTPAVSAADVDGKVSKSGDTMTGNLTTPGLTAEGTGTNPGLAIRNTGGPSGEQRADLVVTSTGILRLRHRADDGTSNIANIVNIDLSDDSVDMAGASSVSAPDATADTHALNRQTADARYGDRLWLGAADLNITDGSPVLGGVNAGRNVGWKMADTGGLQLVAGSVVIPAGWSTYDVNVWWYTSVTTGDVVFRRRVYGKVPGDNGDGGAGAVDTTATVAGVANDITSTTIASANTAGVGGSAIAFLEVGRFANDGADTATSTVSVLGVELVRVS